MLSESLDDVKERYQARASTRPVQVIHDQLNSGYARDALVIETAPAELQLVAYMVLGKCQALLFRDMAPVQRTRPGHAKERG